MQQVKLEVSGMSCGHCVQSIEGSLQTIGAEGKADLASKTVTVRFDDKSLSLNAIKETIEDLGFHID